MAQRGRPAYKPTQEERGFLWEAENIVGQIESLKAELDDVIDRLLDSPIPISAIAKASSMAPTTLAKRRLLGQLQDTRG